MPSTSKTIIVTGSSGLVGSALVEHLAAQGYMVRALQRGKPTHPIPGVTYMPFDLRNVRDEGFAGADAIVHCAYRPVISSAERSHGLNYDILGAEKIIALARKHALRVIFLSSLSAHKDAISYYGQNKLRVEQLFNPHTDTILRLGIVVGGRSGLFGRLRSSIRAYPLVPLLDGGSQKVQTIALGDACRVIERVVATGTRGCYDIAHPRVVVMRDLYAAIADAARVRRVFIPVPAFLMYWIARGIELVGINPPFTSQSVLGLSDLRTSSSARISKIFGIGLRDYQESLREEFPAYDERRQTT